LQRRAISVANGELRLGRMVDRGKITVRRSQCCDLGGNAAVLGLDHRPLTEPLIGRIASCDADAVLSLPIG
jgi:hypothetical protein